MGRDVGMGLCGGAEIVGIERKVPTKEEEGEGEKERAEQTMPVALRRLRSLKMFTYSKLPGADALMPHRGLWFPTGRRQRGRSSPAPTERTTPHHAVGDTHQRRVR